MLDRKVPLRYVLMLMGLVVMMTHQIVWFRMHTRQLVQLSHRARNTSSYTAPINYMYSPDTKRASQNREKTLIFSKKKEDSLPLEFVHATKTGGSAIEKAAAKHGVAWGACHFHCAGFNDMKCPSRSSPQYFEGRVKSTRYVESSLWHIPPQYWSPNLLEEHKTFTVVRNPYSRAVSEYYDKWGGFVGTNDERNDPANMNTWIETNLIERPKGIRYLQHSKYVYDDDGTKIVDVVLHFENLSTEFNQLMESEGLPIRLDDTPFNERTGTALLSVENLTSTTIRRINEYAMADFINFDYEPI